jgi:hypothetical protein
LLPPGKTVTFLEAVRASFMAHVQIFHYEDAMQRRYEI